MSETKINCQSTASIKDRRILHTYAPITGMHKSDKMHHIPSTINNSQKKVFNI